MNQSIKISLLQTQTLWEDVQGNLKQISLKIKSLREDTDILVLPELFSTGFTMEAEKVAESMDGKAVQWMKEVSQMKSCLLMGSLLIKEEGMFFNRLIVTFPDGKILFYDKRHLFSYAGEDKVFEAGQKRLVFIYKGFTICPLICYDLRFPVWSRNTDEYDVLIYVANWPNARMLAWDTLLRARSVENLCYTVGLNRVGTDNNNLVYTGHSAVYNAMGEREVSFDEGDEGLITTELKRGHIEEVRNQFKFLDDKDEFKIL